MPKKLASETPAMVRQTDESHITGAEPTDVFAAQCEQCRQMLLRLALRRTGSLSQAEDMVQQTLLQAWRFRSSFEENALLSTWLTRILFNEIYQAYRRIDRSRLEFSGNLALVEVTRMRADHVTRPADAESQLLRRERRALVRKAVNALPQRYRSVLVLDVYGEKSTQEIAETLCLSLAAVKSRRQRGRFELQRRLLNAI